MYPFFFDYNKRKKSYLPALRPIIHDLLDMKNHQRVSCLFAEILSPEKNFKFLYIFSTNTRFLINY